MGIDTSEIPQSGNSNLILVRNALEPVAVYFDTLSPDKQDALRPYLSVVQTALTAVESFLGGERTFEAPYYLQAQNALHQLHLQMQEYNSKPENETLKKISGSAGHFADRVGQRALEIAGKPGIDKYVAATFKHFGDLRNLLSALESSASVLLDFVRKNAINALWTEFERQKRYARYKSWAWAGLSAILTVVFACVLLGDIQSNPMLLLGVKETTPLGYIALLMLPRTLLKLALAFLAFLSWRMFNNYKHLETGFLHKENASKLIPLLAKEMSAQARETLYSEYLRQVLQPSGDGFIQFAKEKSLVDIQNVSKLEEAKK